MKDQPHQWPAFALLASLSCGPPPDPAPDGGPPDAGPLPTEVCSDPASLYSFGAGEEVLEVRSGGTLAIALGFQGFIMARVMFETSEHLRENVDITSFAKVDGFAETSASHRGIPSGPSAVGRFRTGEMLLFFNDAPLPELVGRRAEVRLRGYTSSCVAWSERNVTLKLAETATTT
ncbi:MAG: hypothetical protein HY791_30060 [Deltaproteobacteria bacterium]|nr:hypothetical protein [Deltaproteobacteria bacterium]